MGIIAPGLIAGLLAIPYNETRWKMSGIRKTCRGLEQAWFHCLSQFLNLLLLSSAVCPGPGNPILAKSWRKDCPFTTGDRCPAYDALSVA